MLGGRDEEHFRKVWAKKMEKRSPSAIYRPGDNQRVDFCIRYLPSGDRFLDIGCGTGVLAEQLRDRYLEVHGVDIADLPVKNAQEKQVNALQLNLNLSPLPYPDLFFDSVTILSTLQYFYDIENVLNEVRRVLKVGGQVVLTVPNMRTYWRLAKLAIKGEFPTATKDDVGYDGGALHYFCYSNLVKLLVRKSLQPVYAGGIFCLPNFLNSIPDQGWLGSVKREFFSAEVVVVAQKTKV